MSAPWSAWQPATCMPGRCFCEAIGNGWIRQPANAASSLAFVVVGIAIAWHAARRDRTAYAAIYVFALLFIGLGSAFYHASLTLAGQFADVFGMYLLGTLVLLYPIARKFELTGVAVASTYAVLNATLGYVLIVHPAARRYLFAALIVPALLLEVMPGRVTLTTHDRKPLLLSATLLSAGFLVWSLDITRRLCNPAGMMQGHAVWHILGALAALALYAYYQSAVVVERAVTASAG